MSKNKEDIKEKEIKNKTKDKEKKKKKKMVYGMVWIRKNVCYMCLKEHGQCFALLLCGWSLLILKNSQMNQRKIFI